MRRILAGFAGGRHRQQPPPPHIPQTTAPSPPLPPPKVTAPPPPTTPEEPPTCRICHCEDGDLYHPCMCTGSIKYVHEECLLDWVRRGGRTSTSAMTRAQCECCGQRLRFSPEYDPAAPTHLSSFELIQIASSKLAHVIPHAIRCAFVLLMWVLLLPVECGVAFRVSLGFLQSIPWSELHISLSSMVSPDMWEVGLWTIVFILIMVFALMAVSDTVRGYDAGEFDDEMELLVRNHPRLVIPQDAQRRLAARLLQRQQQLNNNNNVPVDRADSMDDGDSLDGHQPPLVAPPPPPLAPPGGDDAPLLPPQPPPLDDAVAADEEDMDEQEEEGVGDPLVNPNVVMLDEWLGLRGSLISAMGNAVVVYVGVVSCIFLMYVVPAHVGLYMNELGQYMFMKYVSWAIPHSWLPICEVPPQSLANNQCLDWYHHMKIHGMDMEEHDLQLVMRRVMSYLSQIKYVSIGVGCTSFALVEVYRMCHRLHRAAIQMSRSLTPEDHAFAMSRNAARVLKHLTKSIYASVRVHKVMVLLGVKMILFPFCLGMLLDFVLHPYLQAKSLDRMAFIAEHPLLAVAIVWMAGITHILLVTVNVILLRDVVHHEVLDGLIRMRDPHGNQFLPLMLEPLGMQMRRTIWTCSVYAMLVCATVLPPLWSFQWAFGPHAMLPVTIKWIHPGIEIPLTLAGSHMWMLNALEQAKPHMLAFQARFLDQACRVFGLTSYILPIPVDRRAYLEALHRARVGAGLQHWLDATPRVSPELLQPRDHPNWLYGRLFLLVMSLWAVCCMVIVLVITVPFAVGVMAVWALTPSASVDARLYMVGWFILVYVWRNIPVMKSIINDMNNNVMATSSFRHRVMTGMAKINFIVSVGVALPLCVGGLYGVMCWGAAMTAMTNINETTTAVKELPSPLTLTNILFPPELTSAAANTMMTLLTSDYTTPLIMLVRAWTCGVFLMLGMAWPLSKTPLFATRRQWRYGGVAIVAYTIVAILCGVTYAGVIGGFLVHRVVTMMWMWDDDQTHAVLSPSDAVKSIAIGVWCGCSWFVLHHRYATMAKQVWRRFHDGLRDEKYLSKWRLNNFEEVQGR